MRARITVAILTIVLVVYFVLIGQRGIELLTSGDVIAAILGGTVFLMPVIGAVLVVFELRFGAASARLGRRLAEEGDLPDLQEIPRRPSGRVDREVADAYFQTVKEQVEADRDNWRGWFALGQAYDLAGDRKRARAAVRTAIELAAQEHSAGQTRTRSSDPE